MTELELRTTGVKIYRSATVATTTTQKHNSGYALL